MVDFLYALASFQDYGWFVALIAWAAAGVMWWLVRRRQAGWVWLPWAAAPGLAAAIGELISFAAPVPAATVEADYIVSDFVLGTLTAVTVAGWIWMLPARRSFRLVAAASIFLAPILRLTHSDLGALALAVAGSLAAVAHMASPGATRSSRLALGLSVVALWLSSSGPVASNGLQLRAWVVFGEWSIIWAGVAVVAALAAVIGVAAPWFSDSDANREWRPLVVACLIWLGLGLGLAATMSLWARKNFEARAAARTKATAAFFNKAAVARLFGPEFRFDAEPVIRQRKFGGQHWYATAKISAGPAGVAVRNQLSVIEQEDPDANWTYVGTLREGWLVRIGSAQRNIGHETVVGVSRATEQDRFDWADRRGRFLPLFMEWNSRNNPTVYTSAPLVERGQMLGWLIVGYPRSQWLEAQAQPRVQAYIIVALGLGLVSLVSLQRVRTREREAARVAAQSAMEANQLKTSFLAKVSHELRTPIQSVLGYSDLLRSAVTDPIARGRLRSLRQHGELMLRLVNDLLDLSAIQAGAFRLVEKPTALVELVTQTTDSLRLRAEEKGLGFELSIEPAVPTWASIDGGRVRQVLINLVGNAIKFTDRGRVEVSLARGSGENELVLTVRDTGPGIAAADLGRLFRSFERLDATAAKEGTGLGLALSAALCRGMHGNITVESTEGIGTTFRASFRAAACEAPFLPGSSAGLPPLAGRRVLIADDNALVRELFVASLSDAGAICTAVEDGVAALAVLAGGEGFDAVVLDLAMPRMGGVEAAKKIRAVHGRTLRIVGLSAHAGNDEREEAIGAGMDLFLVKPVQLDELIAALATNPAAKQVIESGRMELLERLREQFHRAAATEGAAIGAAIAANDHAAVRAAAHHLANSASVVRDDWLYSACVGIERAAVAGDEAAIKAAWQTCEAALEPWRHPVDPSAALSGN